MTLAKLWEQNKQIIIVTAAIFIVSASTVLFFVPDPNADFIQTDILGHGTSQDTHESASDSHDSPATDDTNTDSNETAKIPKEDFIKLLEDEQNPYFILNKDAKIDDSSSNFAKMLHLNQKSADGLFLFDFVAKEHQERIFKAYRDVYSDHEAIYKAGPFVLEHGDMEKVVFMSFVQPWNHTDVVLIEVFDVTDQLENLQKRLEDAEGIDDKTRIVVHRLLFAKAD